MDSPPLSTLSVEELDAIMNMLETPITDLPRCRTRANFERVKAEMAAIAETPEEREHILSLERRRRCRHRRRHKKTCGRQKPYEKRQRQTVFSMEDLRAALDGIESDEEL